MLFRSSCTVTKPMGYNGDVYVKWNVGFDDPLNGAEISDIEPSETDSTNITLRSNSQYKYLAYPTFADRPELGNSYNVNVATADRIEEAMGVNNTTATIWCDVLLSDGRYAKSNEIVVGTGSGSGGGDQGDGMQAALDARYAIEMIPANMEAITLADREIIETARELFNALTAAQKEQFFTPDELATLEQRLIAAETKITELQLAADTEAANDVKELINALPAAQDITENNLATVEEAFITAEEAFNNLTPAQQDILGENLGVLSDKLAAVEGKVGQLNQAAADTVTALIAQIQNPADLNPEDPEYETQLQAAKESIENAAAAYNNLSPSQKALIDSDVEESLHDAVEEYNDVFKDTPIDDPTIVDPPIEPVSITAGMITVGNATYTGKALTPQVTVKDGGKVLKEGTDYTKAYSNNVNAGKGKVTVTGKGDYKDTATKEFTISQKAVTPSVTLSPVRYVWNGKVKTPAVTVKDGGAVMAASQYSVSYAAGRKNVGTYTITATLHGNFSGSNAATFTIVPKGATIVKPVAAKKAITVKWKKQAAKMSKSRIKGYQVQCSTNKKFKSGVKKKTVKGYKKTAVKISRLKSKKTYYVRVRTYMKTGGKTYYSNWSKVKAVKVK